MILQRWPKTLREQREKTTTPLTRVSRGHETKLRSNLWFCQDRRLTRFSAHFHFLISHIFYRIQKVALDPKCELQLLRASGDKQFFYRTGGLLTCPSRKALPFPHCIAPILETTCSLKFKRNWTGSYWTHARKMLILMLADLMSQSIRLTSFTPPSANSHVKVSFTYHKYKA